jgi:hypothetical protein
MAMTRLKAAVSGRKRRHRMIPCQGAFASDVLPSKESAINP